MISVSRNIHIPKEEVSRCCSMSAKWCCSACSATWISLLANGYLLLRLVLVIVSFPGDDRRLIEVVGWRRGRGHPLQADGIPWIRRSEFPIPQRPQEINHRQYVTHGKDRSSRGREHVQHLELRRVRMVPAGRTHIAQDELREKCCV